MGKRFRSLRLIALLYQILAWVSLLGGVVGGIVVMVVGGISGRVGQASPVMAGVPVLNRVIGPFWGVVMGLQVILGGAIGFVLLYAISEVIHLGLAIEENTREAAQYIRGEGAVG